MRGQSRDRSSRRFRRNSKGNHSRPAQLHLTGLDIQPVKTNWISVEQGLAKIHTTAVELRLVNDE